MKESITFLRFQILRIKNSRSTNAGLLLILANTIVVILGLIRTPAMTWFLPKEEVGMIGVVGAWIPFVTLLSLPGFDSASHHYISKGFSSAFILNIVYRLRWSILSCITFLAGSFYWYMIENLPLAVIFLITGILFPLTNGLSGISGSLGGLEKYKDLFWYRIIESLVDFTGFIPLILSFWIINKVVTFYSFNQFATALMHVAYTLGLFIFINKSHPTKIDNEEKDRLVKFSKNLTVISAISVMQTRTHTLLVAIISPLTSTADYIIGTIVSEQFRRLWGIYITVRYPTLVRFDIHHRRKSFVYEGSSLFLSFIFIGIIVIYLAHLLIPLILPPNYSSSIVYIEILVVATIVGLPGVLSETFFKSEQNEKSIYYLRITSSFVGIAAPAILILTQGTIGAAYGLLLGNLFFSLFGILLFLRAE